MKSNATMASRRVVSFVALLALISASASAQTLAPAAPVPTTAKPPATTAAKPKPTTATKTVIPAKAPVQKLPAGVVLRVNGRDITSAELTKTLADFGGQPLTAQLMQNAVLEQEAKKLGVSVSNAELTRGIKDAKDQFVQQQMQSGVPMTFKEIAIRDGITDGLITWSVKRNLLMQKTFVKYIEKQVPPLTGQVKVAHIIIPTIPTAPQIGDPNPPAADEQKKRDEESKAKAQQIYDDIKVGKINFEAAAKQFSQDPETKDKGGELFWASRQQLNRLAPEFENAAFGLQKVGDVAGPVKTNFGYHIIKLLKRGETATAAERKAYSDELVKLQTQNPAAAQQWMQSLLRTAVVVRNPNPTSAFPQIVPAKSTTATPAKPVSTTATKPAKTN